MPVLLYRSSRDFSARPGGHSSPRSVTEGRLTNIKSASCKAKLHYLIGLTEIIVQSWESPNPLKQFSLKNYKTNRSHFIIFALQSIPNNSPPEMRRDGNARVETGIPFLTLPSSGWGQYLLLRDSKITRGSRLTVLFPTALALIWH